MSEDQIKTWRRLGKMTVLKTIQGSNIPVEVNYPNCVIKRIDYTSGRYSYG